MCFLWFLRLSWVGWRAVMYVTDLVMFVTRRTSRALYWDRGYTVLRCHFEVRFGFFPEQVPDKYIQYAQTRVI